MAKQEHALPLEVVHAIEAWSIDSGHAIVEDDRILNPDVELAIKELFWHGCDPIRLLDLILGYCTPDPDDGDSKLTPDEFDKRVCKLSEQLASDAEELDEI